MPGASGLLLPNEPVFTVVASTDEFAAFSGVPRETLVGSSLFTYFPDNPAAPNVSNDIRRSLAKCISLKRKNELAVQRYDIGQPDGSFNEMYWRVIHTPILNDGGEITYVIHTAIDVTDNILATKKDARIKMLEPAHNMFMQSSLAIHILQGPELIISLANGPSLKLWGRDESVIGKPLREALPELIEQQFDQIAHNVVVTGQPVQLFDTGVILNRNGQQEKVFLNMLLQPYHDGDNDLPVGVVVNISDVTELHNDRKALEEKERSLELALEIGELGVFSIDFKNATMTYSSQVMQWLGVTEQNMSLTELAKNVHPDDYNIIFKTLTTISEGPRNLRHNLTFRVLHPVTKQVHYLRSIGQLHDEDADAPILTGILQDISKTVQSRAALEQSAQRLRSFIDSAPFPIGVYVGRDMRIEMVNKAILDAWGRDPSVVGKLYADVLPELRGQQIYEQLEEVYATGKAFHAHNRRVDLDHGGNLQSFYFNYSFTPLFNADGSVYGVMNTAADVTDLNVAQMALKESERNFRMMIVQSPVAMCLLRDPEYIVEIANQAMIELWGKTTEQVMHKPVFIGLPDAREQGLEELLESVYHRGETVKAAEMPVTLIRSGVLETVYLNFVYEPYREGSGQITGVMAIAIDVTPQVLARQQIEAVVRERTRELEITNDSLKRSNAELEQFAYIASHDLQEPLRKITMFTSLLQSSITDSDERVQRHMQNISLSAQRMSKLVTDILSYSQLSQMQDPFRTTDLNEILNEVVTDFDFIIEEKRASVINNGLPEINAIPLQMVQLFHNLIGNSLKYSQPDKAPVIEISSRQLTAAEIKNLDLPHLRGPFYAITFKDNGIGFSQQYSHKIFSIFQRLHGRGQYEGTGIGLAMCRKIAETHGGVIYASGVEGEGADFVVVLPHRFSN